MSWKDTRASHRWQSRGRDRLQGIMWYLNQEPASCCGSENSSHGLSLGPPVFMLSYSVTSVPTFSPCSLTVSAFPPHSSPQLLSLLSSLPASLRDWQEVAQSPNSREEVAVDWSTWVRCPLQVQSTLSFIYSLENWTVSSEKCTHMQFLHIISKDSQNWGITMSHKPQGKNPWSAQLTKLTVYLFYMWKKWVTNIICIR